MTLDINMKKLTKLMIAAGVATLALSANAATQTVVKTSTSILDVEANPGNLAFAKFDASLGTLQSVQIQLYNTFSGDLYVENKGPTLQSFTVGANGTLTLISDGGTLTSSGGDSHSFSLGAYDGAADYAGASGGHYTLTPWTQSSSALYSSNLSSFIGTGNYLAAVSGESSQSLVGSGNNKYTTVLNMDAYAEVTYTYAVAAVPEPETYAMLLAGLGLMGVVARRRKSV